MKPGNSLARDLFAWVLGGLGVVWASLLVAGWQAGQHEADELTDGHLASTSALLMAYANGSFMRESGARLPDTASDLRAHDYQQSLSVIIWDPRGNVLARSGDAPEPGFGSPEGFTTLSLGEPPQPWRAFSRWNDSHDRRVMVLLSERERDDLADDIAGQVIAPSLWLLPVVALVLGFAIHRGLRSLHELSQQVHALDVERGQQLDAAARPRELQGTVDAIDKLVVRYQAALERERSLASEFAHELRTPLASISLQARALQDADGAEVPALARRLEVDALRAAEVLSHLLALARASRTELAEAAQPVALGELAQRVVAEMAPQADRTGHELELVADAPLAVPGHAVLLELALRNLLENAVSHTPRGTHVRVEVDAPRRTLAVCDDASDAASDSATPALRLGLGLRVIEKVAAVHGARFEAGTNPAGAGRRYAITFPPQE
ncbi:sensor histidine kinase N-terminal domain-containing protein [Ramlibacter albus]|uniref:histidine kinase n=1 Tax=Ramlibacter albus TaxID=2079448 RepID=A0A923S2R0_9BURK|nr:sensor histidine kinase N-terminal domain-containing protein [Ramlibacter albus]MBC5765038.1 sensor histidine kinase N-terminal domain-containing protein [Ramlibacter albus]